MINGSVNGVPSSPREIAVASRSADYLTISWQHPMLIPPTDRLSYKFVHDYQQYYKAILYRFLIFISKFYSFYYRAREETTFRVLPTSVTSFRFNNLTASSQYIMYVTALNENGESRPSETLIAWTDPAFEPIVEAPIIHPINIVLEGGRYKVSSLKIPIDSKFKMVIRN